MSLLCVNPSVFHGSPGEAPHYISNNSVNCWDCNQSIDLDDEKHYEFNGQPVCEQCRPGCELCQLNVDDEAVRGQAQAKTYGEFDRVIVRLTHGYYHAGCGACEILGMDYNTLPDTTKEQIDARFDALKETL